jgi:hypothetical protein
MRIALISQQPLAVICGNVYAQRIVGEPTSRAEQRTLLNRGRKRRDACNSTWETTMDSLRRPKWLHKRHACRTGGNLVRAWFVYWT